MANYLRACNATINSKAVKVSVLFRGRQIELAEHNRAFVNRIRERDAELAYEAAINGTAVGRQISDDIIVTETNLARLARLSERDAERAYDDAATRQFAHRRMAA